MKPTSYNKEDYNWWIDPAVNSAKQIVPFILKSFPIMSVLDFGCAQGGWLSVFQEHGGEAGRERQRKRAVCWRLMMSESVSERERERGGRFD